jgi:hypothetical protein
MMSEHVYIVALLLAGLCVLGVVALAIIALCLGRPLRAAGRARLGVHHELSLGVEVDAPRAGSKLLAEAVPTYDVSPGTLCDVNLHGNR